MRKAAQSFRFALAGFIHAVQRERNLRIFLCVAAAVLFYAWYDEMDLLEWILLIMVMGMFVTVELVNTALERLTDAYDDCRKSHGTSERHPHLKATKDVAAAASLVSLIVAVVVAAIILYPYVFQGY